MVGPPTFFLKLFAGPPHCAADVTKWKSLGAIAVGIRSALFKKDLTQVLNSRCLFDENFFGGRIQQTAGATGPVAISAIIIWKKEKEMQEPQQMILSIGCSLEAADSASNRMKRRREIEAALQSCPVNVRTSTLACSLKGCGPEEEQKSLKREKDI